MPIGNSVEFSIRGVDRFSGTFSKIERTIGSTIRVTARMTAAATGAATAVAFFANRVGEGEDAAAKFARRIGVAVDQLSKMQHAAKLAGIDTNEFNLATQRMTRRLSEAAKGTGEARQAIAELGLDATKVANLPLSDQLALIADRMEGVNGRAAKLRIAFKLFDSEGASMLQMLKQGSAQMQAMAKDAEFLGIAISKQAAANAEEFTNQTGRLTAAIKGASRAVADEWIPVLTGLAREAANAIAGARSGLEDWATRALRVVVGAFVVMRNVASQLHQDLATLFSGDVWQNFASFASTVIRGLLIAFGGFSDEIGKILVGGFRVAWSAFPALGKWALAQVGNLFVNGIPALVKFMGQVFVRGFSNIVNVASDAWENIKRAITGGHTESMGQIFARNFDEAIKGLAKDAGRLFGDVIDNAPSMSVLFDDLAGDTAQARANMVKIFQGLRDDLSVIGGNISNDLANHFGISTGEVTKQIDEIIAKLKTMGDASQENVDRGTQAVRGFFGELNQLITQQLQQIGTIQKQLAQGFLDSMMSAVDQISSGIAQAVVAGRNFGQVLQQVGRSVLASLIQMLVKVGLQRLLLLGLQKTAEAQLASSQLARASATTYANSFSSTAAIPIVGPALAPGVAAASTATMQAGATAAGAAGAALGPAIAGQAHSGMDSVPREGTYRLNRGERVLAPQQNRDLTRFLQNGGDRRAVHIASLQVSVLPNATSAQALLDIPDTQMREIVARKILRAIDDLDRQGIRQRSIERTGQ